MHNSQIVDAIKDCTDWSKYPGIASAFQFRNQHHKVWDSLIEWLRTDGVMLKNVTLQHALKPFTRAKKDEFAMFCDEIVERFGDSKAFFPNGCPRKAG